MLNKAIIFPIIIIIKSYQLIISPLLRVNRRFLPTCCEYSIQSLKSHGLIKGSFLTLKRIGKCHPWGDDGYDPVPLKDSKK